MKATIEFNLPDEQEEFNYLMKCRDKCREYSIALDNIRESIRSKIKYDTAVTELVEYYLTEIRNMIPDTEV